MQRPRVKGHLELSEPDGRSGGRIVQCGGVKNTTGTPTESMGLTETETPATGHPGAGPRPPTYNVAAWSLCESPDDWNRSCFWPFCLPLDPLPQTVYLVRPQCEVMCLGLLQLHVPVGWYAGGCLPRVGLMREEFCKGRSGKWEWTDGGMIGM